MSDATSTAAWDTELADFLKELSAVQGDLLVVLEEKRQQLMSRDTSGMLALQEREEAIVARLQACQQHRSQLLQRCAEEGAPADDLTSIAARLPRLQRRPLEEKLREAGAKSRMLLQHSLTNWVVVQRTLIHLSHVLEIIATGGRLQPTYGRGEPVNASGSLVDRAA